MTRTNGEFHGLPASADVVIVGGGIAGACAAWDAAQRGLNAVLVEQGDFGGSTSAQSLKILHGGIRYLQHLDIKRLRQSCHERSAFLRIAPHLTRVLPFVVPTAGIGLEGKLAFRAALALLSALTFDRNRGIRQAHQRIPVGGIIGREEVERRFPDIVDERTSGAAVFYDGQMLDPPRLVYAVVRTAAHEGASVANYCRAVDIETGERGVKSVVLQNVDTGEEFRIATSCVVNAAGPFAVESFATPENCARKVNFSRDMALVVDRKFDDEAAITVQTKYKDPDAVLSRGNRHLFMVPWREYTLIGVNSKVYLDSPTEMNVNDDEIQTFLDEINEACPHLALTRDDVLVVNAGLLPADESNVLGSNVSFGKRSVVTDHAKHGGPNGLISAMSVRWTTGRSTAEDAIDLVEQKLGRTKTRCRTAWTPVLGGDFNEIQHLIDAIAQDDLMGKLPEETRERIVHAYGTEWTAIKRLVGENPEDSRLIPGSTVTAAEVRHAVRNEHVKHLADVVFRRTGLGTGSHPGDAALKECAEILGAELNWSEEHYLHELDDVAARFPLSNISRPGIPSYSPKVQHG